MKQANSTILKAIYQEPQIDVIQFFGADVITTSGNRDENQGDWDPQPNGY